MLSQRKRLENSWPTLEQNKLPETSGDVHDFDRQAAKKKLRQPNSYLLSLDMNTKKIVVVDMPTRLNSEFLGGRKSPSHPWWKARLYFAAVRPIILRSSNKKWSLFIL